jgi:hypothetical protein
MSGARNENSDQKRKDLMITVMRAWQEEHFDHGEWMYE